jgi:hypothetical protein
VAVLATHLEAHSSLKCPKISSGLLDPAIGEGGPQA